MQRSRPCPLIQRVTCRGMRQGHWLCGCDDGFYHQTCRDEFLLKKVDATNTITSRFYQ